MYASILWRVQLLVACLAGLCNIAGIFAICSYQKKTNQNIILAYISTIELFNALLDVVHLSLEADLEAQTLPFVGLIVFKVLKWILGCCYLFGMYILTLDRLLCIASPLNYKARLTRKRIKHTLLASVILIIILGTCVTGTTEWSRILLKYVTFMAIGLVILYIMLAIATYILAIYSVRRSRRYFKRDGSTTYQEERRKQFLVPGVIIGTFLVFFMIPFAVNYQHTIITSSNSSLRSRLHCISICFGMLTDPITYIFLCKHYRKSLLKKIQTFIKQNK